MRDEYDKCNFCKHYDTFDGCMDWYCNNYESYNPDKDKLIEVAQQKGISVSDLITLINLE